MIALFKLKRATCKKHRKFPRKHLNNEFTNRKNLKELSYCRNNWIDDDYSYCSGPFYKFFISRLGQSIDKVFSDFVHRCSKNINPKKEFNKWINKECYCGTFYNDNGLLAFTKKEPFKITKINNIDRFSKIDIKKLIKTLYITKIPLCLGEFYFYGGKTKTVYLDIRTKQIPYNRQAIYLPSIGYGIKVNMTEQQTGKVRYDCTISMNDECETYFYIRK